MKDRELTREKLEAFFKKSFSQFMSETRADCLDTGEMSSDLLFGIYLDGAYAGLEISEKVHSGEMV